MIVCISVRWKNGHVMKQRPTMQQNLDVDHVEVKTCKFIPNKGRRLLNENDAVPLANASAMFQGKPSMTPVIFRKRGGVYQKKMCRRPSLFVKPQRSLVSRWETVQVPQRRVKGSAESENKTISLFVARCCCFRCVGDWTRKPRPHATEEDLPADL